MTKNDLKTIQRIIRDGVQPLEQKLSDIEMKIKPTCELPKYGKTGGMIPKGYNSVNIVQDQFDKYQHGMDALFGRKDYSYTCFDSLYSAYKTITGDHDVTGFVRDYCYNGWFNKILLSSLNTYMEYFYTHYINHNWEDIVIIKTIEDYKKHDGTQVQRRGRIDSISKEMICNNDIEGIKRIIGHIAETAYDTFMMYLGSYIIGASEYFYNHDYNGEPISEKYINSDRYTNYKHLPSEPFYNHRNTLWCEELNEKSLSKVYVYYRQKRRYSDNTLLTYDDKKYLVMPYELQSLFKNIEKNHNVVSSKYTSIYIDKKYLANSKKNWYVLEQPVLLQQNNVSGLEVGFIDPQYPCLQDVTDNRLQYVFNYNDILQYSTRHRYGATIQHTEGFLASLYN